MAHNTTHNIQNLLFDSPHVHLWNRRTCNSLDVCLDCMDARIVENKHARQVKAETLLKRCAHLYCAQRIQPGCHQGVVRVHIVAHNTTHNIQNLLVQGLCCHSSPSLTLNRAGPSSTCLSNRLISAQRIPHLRKERRHRAHAGQELGPHEALHSNLSVRAPLHTTDAARPSRTHPHKNALQCHKPF